MSRSPFLNIPDEVYAAAREKTGHIVRNGFHLSAVHQYTTPEGTPTWWVLRLEGDRIDPKMGKTPKRILPMRRTETGFELKRPGFGPEGALLYNLHVLTNYPDDLVYLVEGEACAECLIGLGFIATTWPGGGQSVNRVDWRTLVNRRVVRWPDFDTPGFEAMEKTCRVLRDLGASVVTLDVAALDLPPKGDVVDWLARFVESYGARELCAIPEGHALAWEAIRALPVAQDWAAAA